MFYPRLAVFPYFMGHATYIEKALLDEQAKEEEKNH